MGRNGERVRHLYGRLRRALRGRVATGQSQRDYNHPSIIAWTPINESWGVTRILTNDAQQAHVKALYHLTRSLDSTRLVIRQRRLGAHRRNRYFRHPRLRRARVRNLRNRYQYA
ncbi:MAG: glycoside hydrolase family 2 TIM barrel-domain containing protein [Pyrinomonadaceae bacterium]